MLKYVTPSASDLPAEGPPADLAAVSDALPARQPQWDPVDGRAPAEALRLIAGLGAERKEEARLLFERLLADAALPSALNANTSLTLAALGIRLGCQPALIAMLDRAAGDPDAVMPVLREAMGPLAGDRRNLGPLVEVWFKLMAGNETLRTVRTQAFLHFLKRFGPVPEDLARPAHEVRALAAFCEEQLGVAPQWRLRFFARMGQRELVLEEAKRRLGEDEDAAKCQRCLRTLADSLASRGVSRAAQELRTLLVSAPAGTAPKVKALKAPSPAELARRGDWDAFRAAVAAWPDGDTGPGRRRLADLLAALPKPRDLGRLCLLAADLTKAGRLSRKAAGSLYCQWLTAAADLDKAVDGWIASGAELPRALVHAAFRGNRYRGSRALLKLLDYAAGREDSTEMASLRFTFLLHDYPAAELTPPLAEEIRRRPRLAEAAAGQAHRAVIDHKPVYAEALWRAIARGHPRYALAAAALLTARGRRFGPAVEALLNEILPSRETRSLSDLQLQALKVFAAFAVQQRPSRMDRLNALVESLRQSALISRRDRAAVEGVLAEPAVRRRQAQAYADWARREGLLRWLPQAPAALPGQP